MALNGGAAALVADGAAEPVASDVRALVPIRTGWWEEATRARATLADPAPLVSPAEVLLRSAVHDATRLDHDKDFRQYVLFPPERLRAMALLVCRVGPDRTLHLDILWGSEASADCPVPELPRVKDRRRPSLLRCLSSSSDCSCCCCCLSSCASSCEWARWACEARSF